MLDEIAAEQLRRIGDTLAEAVMMVLNQCTPVHPEHKRALREAAEIWNAASAATQDG